MSTTIPSSGLPDKRDQINERPARYEPPGRSEHLSLELSILESENALRREERSSRDVRRTRELGGPGDARSSPG